MPIIFEIFDDFISWQVERREDEEQNVKQQDIFDILVAAGYFRARIKGLSPFDKIVGGMTWCISACDYDIDVDLLFHENLTIGQKMFVQYSVFGIWPIRKFNAYNNHFIYFVVEH